MSSPLASWGSGRRAVVARYWSLDRAACQDRNQRMKAVRWSEAVLPSEPNAQRAPSGAQRSERCHVQCPPSCRRSHLREQTLHLAERLDAITAAAMTRRALLFEIRHDVPPEPMVPLLDALDRDLVLAPHGLE
jgi:hypothetical protein